MDDEILGGYYMNVRYMIAGLVLSFPILTSVAAEPLSRQQAIDIALDGNPEVIAAEKAWKAAQARSTQAGAFPEPELELEYEELPGMTRFGDFGERSFGVTQPIESPFKWWRRRQAAHQAAEAVHLGVLGMSRLDITAQVEVAYDRILLQHAKLSYSETAAQLAGAFLEKARLRLEAGDIRRLEVLVAEVEAGRAVNRLSQARSDLAVARAELNTLLGRGLGRSLTISGQLTLQKRSLSLEALQKLALERRPDLRGAESALSSARSEQGAAKAALLPDLDLKLFRHTVREPTGSEDYWRVGLALQLPLWGASRQRGEWAEAAALAEQAAAEMDHRRNQILLEVEIAFLKAEMTSNQAQLFEEDIVRAAEGSFEMAASRYRVGKATYLEVLDAQRALMEVREEYAEALFNHQVALTDLARAIGGQLPDD